MRSVAENGQLATDGCLLLSNYTDEGSVSHLQLHRSTDEAVHASSSLLIDKWTVLNKQRHAVTQVSHLLDQKEIQADVLLC